MRQLGALVLVTLAFSVDSAYAEQRRDLEKELRLLEQGQRPELGIPGAKNRVAVFAFEDPDRTGLGNALGSLVAREILLGSRVTSIGVLRYEGGLSPVTAESLSYFDKVERVTEAQQVTLAVWGVVRRVDEMLAIETFVQVPQTQLDRSFRWAIRLPMAMGGQELVAHLQPNRILAQRFEVPRSAEAAFRAAARSIDELREAPRSDAEVQFTLPLESVYFIEKREQDWIYVNAGPGRAGWVPVRDSCTEDCATLLESARFTGGLLRYMDSKEVPQRLAGLSEDALAAIDQIGMFHLVNFDSSRNIEAAWNRIEGDERGTDFANLRAMVRIAIDLKSGVNEEYGRSGGSLQVAYEKLSVDKARALEVAFELADASLSDPGNADILHNLAILFEYGGDTRRADLARHLAAPGSK